MVLTMSLVIFASLFFLFSLLSLWLKVVLRFLCVSVHQMSGFRVIFSMSLCVVVINMTIAHFFVVPYRSVFNVFSVNCEYFSVVCVV